MGADIAREFFTCKEALREVRRDLEGLPRQEQHRIAVLADDRRSEQLRLYLDRFQIRHYNISGIGASRLQTLTSYGIETAADVVRNRILAVPGFGPVNSRPLLEWRAQLESRFTYSAIPIAGEKVVEATIKADIARKSAHLRNRLAAGPRELANIAAAALQRCNQPDLRLEQVHRAPTQAMVDLHFLGLTMPTVRSLASPSAPVSPPYQPTPSGHTAKHDRFRNRFNDCPRWSPERFAAHQTGVRAVARRCHPLEKRCAGRYHLREPGCRAERKVY